ncbi:MAG TPA: hypothetical protein VFW79_10785 [Cellulomonas sp.]|uniref:hypothetical protein n=1 Tax=Cellulomonas sp. TaxID=40001 RepID=UPI002E2EE9B0|nr:hypothetical protein [Cellulomonas sp.]HEX5333117.1 hypothetical protein [Cellulomonas sp.]
MSPVITTPTEPRRTLEAAALALRSWTPRQRLASGVFAVAFALLIGIPTVLIPNPVFGREVPVQAWNYPVWIASSILAGMLAATYVRSARDQDGATAADEPADTVDAPSRFGMVGGVLAWFAVGCPVCNKLALLALGYSGAITWFAPVQPYLAAAALLMTAGALLVRLRGQILCSTPRISRRRQPVTPTTGAGR